MKNYPSIVSRTDLVAMRQGMHQQNQKVVFTNGCFDLIHRGHIECLREARQLGDVLIVGLNSDTSVQALKGPDRPLIRQEDRAVLLAELRSVTYVCIFDEISVEKLVGELMPDILVKGGDYRPEEIVGHEIVTAAGGQVKVLSLLPQYSTSFLIERIK
jgi:D-beta-D-heptose 7-phosphate kinase/D-beta-D-heptose 1-phosphate adenosyltransferase